MSLIKNRAHTKLTASTTVDGEMIASLSETQMARLQLFQLQLAEKMDDQLQAVIAKKAQLTKDYGIATTEYGEEIEAEKKKITKEIVCALEKQFNCRREDTPRVYTEDNHTTITHVFFHAKVKPDKTLKQTKSAACTISVECTGLAVNITNKKIEALNAQREKLSSELDAAKELHATLLQKQSNLARANRKALANTLAKKLIEGGDAEFIQDTLEDMVADAFNSL